MAKIRRIAGWALVLALVLVGQGFVPVQAGQMPAAIAVGEAAGGKVLTDARGMTLYVFDKDKPGTSNCYGGCAEKWPPLIAAAGAKAVGDFSLVMRKDGTRQWAYRGRPLYTWFKDRRPGDATGDGVKGVWHVARP